MLSNNSLQTKTPKNLKRSLGVLLLRDVDYSKTLPSITESKNFTT